MMLSIGRPSAKRYAYCRPPGSHGSGYVPFVIGRTGVGPASVFIAGLLLGFMHLRRVATFLAEGHVPEVRGAHGHRGEPGPAVTRVPLHRGEGVLDLLHRETSRRMMSTTALGTFQSAGTVARGSWRRWRYARRTRWICLEPTPTRSAIAWSPSSASWIRVTAFTTSQEPRVG